MSLKHKTSYCDNVNSLNRQLDVFFYTLRNISFSFNYLVMFFSQ